jgi:hypothetical protein
MNSWLTIFIASLTSIDFLAIFSRKSRSTFAFKRINTVHTFASVLTWWRSAIVNIFARWTLESQWAQAHKPSIGKFNTSGVLVLLVAIAAHTGIGQSSLAVFACIHWRACAFVLVRWFLGAHVFANALVVQLVAWIRIYRTVSAWRVLELAVFSVKLAVTLAFVAISSYS